MRFEMYKKILIPSILIIGLILFSNSCKENTTEPTKTESLIAKLVDAADNPVPDAFVQALKGNNVISSDTTDDEGMFELANIPGDLAEVSLLVRSSGFPEMKAELNKLMKSNEFNSGKKIQNFKRG